MDRDLTALENMAENHKNIMRTLSSLMYDHQPLIRWRAVEVLGRISKIIAGTDPEKVRRQIRRILWLMNDESGGLCWNGPEAIGEIIYNNPVLIYEYGPIITSFLSEEPFEAGTRRAIWRVGSIGPEIFNESKILIIKSLESPIPEMRAFSIEALNSLDDTSAYNRVKMLKNDSSPIEIYDFVKGELKKATVAECSRIYLERLNKLS
ncbi:MAG: hypothetical protein JSW64_00565 [Candidatus Zixiibacteriota bacterium]|nr:MAG: hypothetical protein JSW64_00565 [candidate division Zixibacteria bacterium]